MTDPNQDELDPQDLSAALAALEAEGSEDVQSDGDRKVADEDQGDTDEGVEDTEDESVEDESEENDDQEDEDEDTTGQAKRKVYFGVDLTDVDEATREAVITDLKNKDKYTNRVSQENSALAKKVEELETFVRSLTEDEESAAPEIEMPSDDEIVAQLGLDPEDPFFEIKRDAALPPTKLVLRQQLEAQAAQTAEQKAAESLEEYANNYMTTLDTLEGEHGELPIEREEFLSWAAENDLHDPTEAYNTFAEMAKEIIDQGVGEKEKPKPDPKRDEAKRLAKKKASVGSRKPAGGTQPTEGEDLDDIIRRAIAEVGFEGS